MLLLVYEQDQSLKSSETSMAATWCTEPEIDSARQAVLHQCLANIPDVKMGIYPFKDMQLSRDVCKNLTSTH